MWRLGVLGAVVIACSVACGSDDQVAQGGGGAAAPSMGGASAGASSNAGGGAATGDASTGGQAASNGGASGRDAATGANGGLGLGGTDAAAGGTPAGGGGASGAATGGAHSGGAGGRLDGGGGRPADSGAGGAPVRQTSKLDVLLIVDNSSSMQDKQDVLKQTIPDLVQKLTDPALNVVDLHVGVVTSSLGDHGANSACTESVEDRDDHGHLLATRPRAASLNLPSGFASWARPAPTDALVADVQGMVGVAGQDGCGLEATLEAAYRFLVDPEPPASIVLSTCGGATCAVATGIDSELIAQRRAFLRPDSAVAVIIISDENDCSIRDGGQNYLVANLDIFLPAAATVCGQNPNDPCCYSCAASPPTGCQPDPACQGPPYLTATADPANLRCYEQRRRFGVDFLYPVARYVNAFTRPTLCLSRADVDASKPCPALGGDAGPAIVENPLFAARVDGGRPRDASMVYFLGIVGVPWQTIRVTKDSAGNPLPADSLIYPSGASLSTLWPAILGDPSASPPKYPTDPLMIESIDPRTGVTPGTGEALAPPTAGYLANSVNGHEGAILAREDLQHTCIFPLVTPKNCTTVGASCDCYNPPAGENNPVCQASNGTYGTTQYFARAYPGLRHLSVLEGLGDQAALASICAKNLTDDTLRDFGYRPAVDALMVELDRSIR